MPAELQDYQWELGGLVFGYDCPVDHESDVAPPDYSLRNEDQPNPGHDGMRMGVDLIEPGAWQFKLFVNTDDEASALAALSAFRKVWRGDAYRKEPGKATELRYRLGGRTRVVYGRPRRLSAPIGVEFLSGAILVTCDFQTVSEMFFDDVEGSIWVDHRQPETGGFVTPFSAPLTSQTSAASVPHSFTVDGELATPVVVDFHGPLNSSGLLIDGKPFIEFQQDIAADTVVTVDARPWVTAVSRQDGGGVAGLLSPRSRMPRMLLEPGVHTATLLGTSPTGTGRARVRWRPAYPSV